MTQTPERAAVQNLLRAAPRRQFGKVEVDDRRLPASPRRLEHGPRGGEIGGERLLDEDGLSEVERAARDLGLEIGRHRDGNGGDGAILDQRPPIAEPARDIRRPGQFGRARAIASRQRHDLAARIGAECGQQHGSPIVAADDADADHRDALRCGGARATSGEVPGLGCIPMPFIALSSPLCRSQIPHRKRGRETPGDGPIQIARNELGSAR